MKSTFARNLNIFEREEALQDLLSGLEGFGRDLRDCEDAEIIMAELECVLCDAYSCDEDDARYVVGDLLTAKASTGEELFARVEAAAIECQLALTAVTEDCDREYEWTA